METVPFGIIGCGYRGRELAELAVKSGLPLVAVADAYESMADKLATDFSTPEHPIRWQSVGTLLASRDLKAVVVATPTITHLEVVEAAARAHKHILCEKPLAEIGTACKVMNTLCKDFDVRLAVGSQCRLWAVPAFVKEQLLSKVGHVHSIVMKRLTYAPEISLSGWRADLERNPGGQLMDHHIHNIDLLNWMFGQGRVLSATASTGIHSQWEFPDQYHALLAYGDALCTFVASEASLANEWSLVVDGENGTLKVPAITWRQDVDPIVFRPYDRSKQEEVYNKMNVLDVNPNTLQLQRFLHAIATGGPTDTTVEDGTEAVSLINEIERIAVHLN